MVVAYFPRKCLLCSSVRKSTTEYNFASGKYAGWQMIPVRSLHNLITTHEREIFLFHLFPSHASVSTISISLTTFCQLNLFARKSPFWIKCLRSSESLINLEIPLVIASSERGSTRIAASPATSGNDEVREVNTGIPQAMLSTTGNPKPSYKEGKLILTSPYITMVNLFQTRTQRTLHVHLNHVVLLVFLNHYKDYQ